MAAARGLLRLLLSSALLVCCGAEEVVSLTSQNFDQTNQGTWLVNFSAPWCGHCKRLAPVYEKVAEHFHADRASAVRIAKMDATAETEIAERYNVVGFPSIVLLQGGTSHDFKGQRTFEEIVRFVESHAPKKAPTPAGGALTATAQLTAAGERLIAVMHQLRDYVREVFTTLTVAEVAWSYWRFGASLSGLIFIAIASIQTLDQRRED
ncbi:thioredoxin-like protein [Pavlovales sp. CCMP2436]|nr:thioredoxin-like protein [Pavlovales sp. CCMP2436]|mmetsp:Transcript_20003/g.50955  ORF Transcript_20003/g.50955 Transcript_20003/m.50955 type:complete len:208 (-) Transcript_20003:152-775(-)